MKRIVKVTALLMVSLFMLLTLTACFGVSKDEVVGTYSGSYVHNGNEYSVGIVLGEDGTYAEVVIKNGELSSSETGDFEIKGNKVLLYDSESSTYHGICTKYKFKKDTLINNGHEFTKE